LTTTIGTIQGVQNLFGIRVNGSLTGTLSKFRLKHFMPDRQLIFLSTGTNFRVHAEWNPESVKNT
jgi:hypothetical protein